MTKTTPLFVLFMLQLSFYFMTIVHGYATHSNQYFSLPARNILHIAVFRSNSLKYVVNPRLSTINYATNNVVPDFLSIRTVSTKRKRCTLLQQKRVLNDNLEKKSEGFNSVYNDDCFGLIFLIGSFIAKDAIFVTTFLFFSSIALLASRYGSFDVLSTRLYTRKRLPAIVAALTIVSTTIIASFVDMTNFVTVDSALEEKYQLLEIGACLVSIACGTLTSTD